MLNKKQAWLSLTLILLAFSTGCVPNNFAYNKEYGKSGSGTGEFLSATDMDKDSDGNLVVADAGNTRFQVITTSGNVIKQGGEFGTDRLKLQSISGIGVDQTLGFIWVCDQKGNKLVRFDSDGRPDIKVTKNMKFPMDVTVDNDSNLYVIMTRNPDIYKYDSEGNFIDKIGGKGKGALVFPTSITIHKDVLYVTDFGGKRIAKFDLDGNYIEEIKNKGEYEEMQGPSGLTLDEDGNLYVLDLGEVPVVVLTPDGKLISQIGSFGNQEGSFLYPTGVIAKSKDDVFVLDNSRNAIINFKKKSQ